MKKIPSQNAQRADELANMFHEILVGFDVHEGLCALLIVAANTIVANHEEEEIDNVVERAKRTFQEMIDLMKTRKANGAA